MSYYTDSRVIASLVSTREWPLLAGQTAYLPYWEDPEEGESGYASSEYGPKDFIGEDGQVLPWIGEEPQRVILATFSASYHVCPTCEGRGRHVNPSIDAHGISPDEFAEDPDFAHAYFAGRYDQTCNECRGERVILDIDLESQSHWSEGQTRAMKDWNDSVEADWDYARESAYERRMGY